MRQIDYLFLCLAEEASEVAQAASKCIRFTPDHAREGFPSNIRQLELELNDLMVILQLLEELGYPINLVDKDAQKDKVQRFLKYVNMSQQMGTLQHDHTPD